MNPDYPVKLADSVPEPAMVGRGILAAGGTTEDALWRWRQDGLSKDQSADALRAISGVSSEEAAAVVDASRAWYGLVGNYESHEFLGDLNSGMFDRRRRRARLPAESPERGDKPVAACRLAFVMARDAPVAAILRRGPTKWVQLIKWNTDTDTFEPGQWFHGRIYERLCDLSPDGSLFIYSTLKLSGPRTDGPCAWTAISKLPYLTALLFWPGVPWQNGGGRFRSNTSVELNRWSSSGLPRQGRRPNWLEVVLENWEERMDLRVFRHGELEGWGWRPVQAGIFARRSMAPFLNRPEVWQKPFRNRPWLLQKRLLGFRNGCDEVEDVTLKRPSDGSEIWLEGITWADWDQHGQLVFARHGRLYASEVGSGGPESARELADFNPAKPERVAAPDWATRW